MSDGIVNPDATPEVVADTTPGTVQDGNAASPTGEEAKVEETPEQVAERERNEERKRRERAQRKLNERFRELTDTIKSKDSLIERLVAQREQPKPAQETDQAPQRADYDDYEAYIRALARYDAKQEVAGLTKAEQARQQTAQQQFAEQLRKAALVQSHGQRVAAYAKSNPDFAEVMDSDVDVGSAAEALMEMDDGPAVMVALHRNPEIAERLRNSSAHMQGVILGQLSAALKSKPPQVSKAPPPGQPVGVKSAAGPKDLAELSVDDYIKERRKQRASG